MRLRWGFNESLQQLLFHLRQPVVKVTSDPPLMMGAFLIPPPLVDKGGSGSRCIRLVGGAAMDTPWVSDQDVAHLQAKGLVRISPRSIRSLATSNGRRYVPSATSMGPFSWLTSTNEKLTVMIAGGGM